MTRHRDRKRTAGSAPSFTLYERAVWIVVCATVIVTPILVSVGGKDSFRLPKWLVLRAAAIVLTAIFLQALATRRLSLRQLFPRGVFYLPLAALGWAVVTTLVALHPTRAQHSLIDAAAAAVFAIGCAFTLQKRNAGALAIPLIPATVNAVFALFQSAGFEPAGFPNQITALVGNPNDLGSTLAPVVLAAVVLAALHHGRWRWAFASLSLVVASGLVVSRTMTAIVATIFGVVVLSMFLSRRAGVLVLAAGLLAAGAGAAFYPPVAERVFDSIAWARAGKFDRLLTFRLTPFLAAWNMMLGRPLVGVGPGGFGPEYFDWKIQLQEKYPDLLRHVTVEQQNFGEVHNDHLQILAETGIPGYLLFLAALGAVAQASFERRGQVTGREHAARLLGAPLALTLAVLALAQFPLHLAAALVNFLYFGAACVAWRPEDGSAPPATSSSISSGHDEA